MADKRSNLTRAPQASGYDSITVGGVTTFSDKGLEQYIKDRKINRDDAQTLRLEHQKKLFALRRSAAREANPGLASASPFVSTIANLGNQAALGAPAAAVSAALAPLTAMNRGVGLGEAFQLNRNLSNLALGANPTAQTVGTLGAFLNPSSPASRVAQAGFRAAGGARLAQAAASAPTLGQAAIAQLRSAVQGGAGALTAVNLASGVFDERPVSEVIADTIEDVNPFTGEGFRNLSISLALGAVPAVARAVRDPATRELWQRATRRLGSDFQPSPDMLRHPNGVVAWITDALSKAGGGQRIAQDWARKHFFGPMREAIGNLRTRGGAGNEQAVRRGASAVRSLLPTEERVGALTRQRQRIGREAFAAEGTIEIPRAELQGLQRAIGSINQRARSVGRSEGPRGGQLTGILRDLQRDIVRGAREARAGRPFRVNMQALENLRQRLGDVADFGTRAGPGALNATGISGRDVRDAKFLYRAIRQTMRRVSRQQGEGVVDRAMRDLADLRAAETALKQVANVANLGDDLQLVRGVYSAPNFERRWRQIERFLPQERVQALRGAYLADFLERVTLERGKVSDPDLLLSEPAVRRLMGGSGPFRRAVFDRVLPGFREEIEDLAKVSSWFSRSAIGGPVGSQTAQREEALEVVQGVATLSGSAVGLLNDPSVRAGAISRVLGFAGQLGFIQSLLNGRIGQFLNTTATGGAVAPNQRAAAALNQAGGLGNVLSAGADVGSGAVSSLLSGTRAASQQADRFDELIRGENAQ